MKTLSKVLLSILALFILSSVGGYFYMKAKFRAPANQLVVTQLPAAASFAWLADTVEHRAMPHAAVLVPVTLPGCARTCYLQFDTGAPFSVIYDQPLAALRQRFPATAPALQPQGDTLHNFRFALGQGQIQARRVLVHHGGAQALPADTTQPFVIGTLGADVLEGRALVIDYAAQRFTLYQTLPAELTTRAAFVPMTFEERRVILTPTLEGNTQQLLFDSGSSAFALLTSQEHFQELAQAGAPVRKVGVNSWGKTLTSYTAPTAATLQMGSTTLPLQTVTHIEGTSFLQRNLMRFSGMGGMLGNAPFARHTIILDVRGGRFGVL